MFYNDTKNLEFLVTYIFKFFRYRYRNYEVYSKKGSEINKKMIDAYVLVYLYQRLEYHL